MAKYVNNRFYFEKMTKELSGFAEKILEITEVVNTGITNALYIWDQVYFNKETSEDLCDFCITVSKETREEENLLIEKNWWKIINTRLESADKLSLGLWKSHNEIINDILNRFEILSENDFGEQMVVNLRITPELIFYLERNSFYSSKEIKWFDFTLSKSDNGKEKTILISTHSGHYISVFEMTKTEVDLMLSQLDENSLQIDILPTHY